MDRQKKNKYLIIVSSTAIVLGLVSGKFFSGADKIKASPFKIPLLSGASDPSLRSSTGATAEVSLSDFKGMPLLINFWASWCERCKQEKQVFERYLNSDPKLKVLQIAAFDDKREIYGSGFVRKPFTIGHDESGQVSYDYQIGAIPQSVLIDEEGNIIKRFFGALKESDLKEMEILAAQQADKTPAKKM
jgi:thiol-disulfide isomerase/thioredoxin